MYLIQIKTPAHRPVAEVRTKAAITKDQGESFYFDADEVVCMLHPHVRSDMRPCSRYFAAANKL